MASLVTSIQHHDSGGLPSGTKRAKFRRLISSFSGTSPPSENGVTGYETPPSSIPDQFAGISPTKQAFNKVRFFFSKHWHNSGPENTNPLRSQSNGDYSVGDYSCYNRYKTDGQQLEKLFDNAVIDRKKPISWDDRVRKMAPFEAMDPSVANVWMEKIHDFNITFSPVEAEPNTTNSRSSGNVKTASATATELGQNQTNSGRASLGNSSKKSGILDTMEKVEIDWNTASLTHKSSSYEYGNPSALPDLFFGVETIPSGSGKDSPLQDSSVQLIKDGHGFKGSATGGRSLKSGSKIFTSNALQSKKSELVELNSSQKVVIPTFREEAGLEVHSIASNFQVGTLTESDLIKLASAKRRSFMDANFYDEDSDLSNNEPLDKDQEKFHRQPTPPLNCDINLVEKSEKNDTVKFNKYSYLVIYDASKKCLYSESTDKLTLRIPNETTGSTEKFVDAASESASCRESMMLKSILKCRTNEQEDIEVERAKKCDEIDATDFLEFVENHESKKRKGETLLVLARERQLQNYYDDQFFPTVKIRKEKRSFSDFEDEYSKILE
ncbi:unnamed protein product [Kluyveromyces dobzhanskii CBS 2104]|uniref:WGS project CCBQ000000000 data, contig 00107 n=1 Tax=Kluyveromyces dobzhanskii CBS 2104 TaxID=1427455 RepID=A0A0A8L1H2_9SACH|nr:unnamed protein product [Kluyveromyces dobzhanskii CBS 2104]